MCIYTHTCVYMVHVYAYCILYVHVYYIHIVYMYIYIHVSHTCMSVYACIYLFVCSFARSVFVAVCPIDFAPTHSTC